MARKANNMLLVNLTEKRRVTRGAPVPLLEGARARSELDHTYAEILREVEAPTPPFPGLALPVTSVAFCLLGSPPFGSLNAPNQYDLNESAESCMMAVDTFFNDPTVVAAVRAARRAQLTDIFFVCPSDKNPVLRNDQVSAAWSRAWKYVSCSLLAGKELT